MTTGGNLTDRLKNAGISIAIIGVFLLLISFGGRMYVLDGYANANPDDETGPCEGWQRDAEVCNTVSMLDSLWIPGWVLLFLGVVVTVIGVAKS